METLARSDDPRGENVGEKVQRSLEKSREV
jgi:hypothetical protein